MIMCKKSNLRHCESSRKNFKNLEEIVADYIAEYRKKSEEELLFYAEKSFLEVVNLAAEAKGLWEGIHDHQKKYGVAAKLPVFAQSLLKALPELAKSRSFENLYDSVWARKVKGVGKLTVYDTALRIGAHLKIEPRDVYLHCGTKEGAKNLGISQRGRRSVSVDEFPAAFRKLKPREIEDCLCIYKNSFQGVRRT